MAAWESSYVFKERVRQSSYLENMSNCSLWKLKHQDSSEDSLPFGKKVGVSKSGVSKLNNQSESQKIVHSAHISIFSHPPSEVWAGYRK
jgi:hypothetical protein